MIAGSGERTEASRQLEEASRLAEEAATHAASAAAAASLGQSMRAQGMLEAGQGALNTVSERGIPCKVSIPAPLLLLSITFSLHTIAFLHDHDLSVTILRMMGAYVRDAFLVHIVMCSFPSNNEMRLADGLHCNQPVVVHICRVHQRLLRTHWREPQSRIFQQCPKHA